MSRYAFGLLAVVAAAGPGLAQSANLTDKTALGDRVVYSMDLALKGNLIVVIDAGKQPILLEATARHRFTERVLGLTDGLPSSSARLYSEAAAKAIIGTDKVVRSLPTDQRVIVARSSREGRTCFAIGGPLTRDDLDLVTDHFNPQCLPGLLPGRMVSVGDTWAIGEAAAQTACSFDATIKTTLTGKLTGVADGIATFAIEGTAEGMENGGKARLAISATGTFEVAAGHVTGLIWKQIDDREQGPVNPASHVEATVTLTRQAATAEPKELSDDALGGVAAGAVPGRLLDLRFADPKGRYQLVHSRNWHVTGQTEAHVVLRLVDRGEFVAQATITSWNQVEPGKHVAIEDFKKAASAAPGWTPGKVLVDRELPAPPGHWLYRLSVEGKMDNVPVVQSYYVLAGPHGEQLVVTVAAKPDKLMSLGTRDLDLVNGIEFGRR